MEFISIMSAITADIFMAVNFVRKFLNISGHWPNENVSVFAEIRSFLSLFSASVFSTMNLLEVIFHFSNFKDFAENMSVTAPVCAFVSKLIIFKLNRKKFFNVMEMMKKSNSFKSYSKRDCIYVNDMNEKCILITKVYGGTCAVVVTLYAALALSSESVLPIKFSYDFGSWIYGMYIFQMTAIMNVAANTVCLDMLAICFMGTVISQLEILEQKILLFNGSNESEVSKEKEYTQLKHCVSHHTEIIQFVTAIEDVFTMCILSQYLCSIFSICNIGFQLANVRPMDAEFIKVVLYFSAMMWQLAMYCWFGNEIVVKSMAVGDACYKSNWTESTHNARKILVIIMTRSNRMLALTAAKFSPLSLNSLTTIMNASYSYFALMQRMYKKEQI